MCVGCTCGCEVSVSFVGAACKDVTAFISARQPAFILCDFLGKPI